MPNDIGSKYKYLWQENLKSKHLTTITDRKSGKILSIGYNYFRDTTTNNTCHSEVDAYKKLPKLKYMIDVDVTIVRYYVKQNMSMGISYPCTKCVDILNKLKYKGYRVYNVHYSNELGTITTINISEIHKIKYETISW